MIPEAHAASGELNPQLAVVGLLLEHRLDLSEGLRVPVKLQKHAGVFSARGSIVRCPLEHGRQQDLRIIEYAPGNADARQEPHGLHMIAVREQVGAHPRLGASRSPSANSATQVSTSAGSCDRLAMRLAACSAGSVSPDMRKRLSSMRQQPISA